MSKQQRTGKRRQTQDRKATLLATGSDLSQCVLDLSQRLEPKWLRMLQARPSFAKPVLVVLSSPKNETVAKAHTHRKCNHHCPCLLLQSAFSLWPCLPFGFRFRSSLQLLKNDRCCKPNGKKKAHNATVRIKPALKFRTTPCQRRKSYCEEADCSCTESH